MSAGVCVCCIWDGVFRIWVWDFLFGGEKKLHGWKSRRGGGCLKEGGVEWIDR